ncbi:MAG: hypothetical protein K2X09_06435, partial [Rickettsiales bacterium]|nr:hypothetical protein [Rickettsiales bacterium]
MGNKKPDQSLGRVFYSLSCRLYDGIHLTVEEGGPRHEDGVTPSLRSRFVLGHFCLGLVEHRGIG